MIPATPPSCSCEKKVDGGERERRRDRERERGATMMMTMRRRKRRDEEEVERSPKTERLTVIIVVFNHTPAIKLINTLFPAGVPGAADCSPL